MTMCGHNLHSYYFGILLLIVLLLTIVTNKANRALNEVSLNWNESKLWQRRIWLVTIALITVITGSCYSQLGYSSIYSRLGKSVMDVASIWLLPVNKLHIWLYQCPDRLDHFTINLFRNWATLPHCTRRTISDRVGEFCKIKSNSPHPSFHSSFLLFLFRITCIKIYKASHLFII